MVEAVVTIEVIIPFVRLALPSKLTNPHDQVGPRGKKERGKNIVLLEKNSRVYNKKVKPRPICVRYLVLKAVGHIHDGLSAFKFSHKWMKVMLLKSLTIVDIFELLNSN